MEKIPTHRSSRTAAVLMAAAAIMPLASHVAHADSLVQQEIARRALRVQDADAALLEGRQLYTEGKFEEAVAKYSEALGLLPPGPAVADRRHAYTGHLVDGSIALSTKLRRVGKYSEARQLLGDVLVKDPRNAAALQELEYLDDPIRTNPALTYSHTQDVDKVRKHLYLAEGYFNLGKYDDAESEYKEVLRLDRYNKAARRGMERINNVKSDYYRAAYDHTRSELLAQVDKAWELAVPPRVLENPGLDNNSPSQVNGASLISRKLKSITLPVVDFQDVTVDQAIDVLRQRARELDTSELDPSKRGVNFVLRLPAAGADGGEVSEDGEFGEVSQPGSKRIDSLQLRNVPLEVAIQQICDATGLRFKVEDYAVVLLSANDVEDTEFYTRSFNVPPDFIALINNGDAGGGGGAAADPFADDDDGGGLAATPPVKDLLVASGVVFPEGATASFSKARAVLTVRNTANNLDILNTLVQDIINRKPKQIRMSTKFVEVSQENSDELSFDWILSPSALSANSFLGGGSIGNGANRTGANFSSPVDGFPIPGIGGANESVNNIVTSGLRSGSTAISPNSIDSFLNNPDRSSSRTSVAPGILSMTGLFTNGQVQMIMRGLAQKKGADIMTAPSIVARSGETATIEIVREFIYPTEYEPPEIPNSTGGTFNDNDGGGFGGGGQAANVFPVTPATPTAFETRNTGVILEVQPTIGEDGYTIDLSFAPEIVDFEGFINYGSPIQTSASDQFGNPVTVTITENRIEMPVFSTRKVKTALTIYDGHTVAVGGLMREDVQNVEDKVPVLGDLPLVGRLFQSKAENRIKSNLIIFVSADIIDATGQSLRNADGDTVDPVDSGLFPTL